MNLGELITSEQHRAYRLALRITGSAEAAAEAVQTACASVLGGKSPGRVESPRAWFLKSVVYTARHMQRDSARRKVREEKWAMGSSRASDLPADLIAETELREKVAGALEEVDSELRTALEMHYREGLTHAEIATVLDMPRSTVGSRLEQGLERLRGILRERGVTASSAGVAGALGAWELSAAPEVLTAAIGKMVAGSAAAKAAVATSGAAATAGVTFLWKALAGIAALVAVGLGSVALVRPGWMGLGPAQNPGLPAKTAVGEKEQGAQKGAGAKTAPAPAVKWVQPASAARNEKERRENAALIAAALKKPVVARYRGDGIYLTLSDVGMQTGIRWYWSGNFRQYVAKFSMDTGKRKVPLKDVMAALAKAHGVTAHLHVLRRSAKRRPDLVLDFWKKADPVELAKLRAELGSDDVDVRCRAADRLSNHPSPQHVRLAYERLLVEKHPAVVGWLVISLGNWMPLEFAPIPEPLLRIVPDWLESKGELRARFAARVLGLAGKDIPVKKLTRLLDDRAGCWAAAAYLEEREDDRFVPNLAEMLGNEGSQWTAYRVLERYRTEAADAALWKAAEQQSLAGLRAAGNCPDRFGREKVIKLMARVLEGPVAWQQARAAARMLGHMARTDPAAWDALTASDHGYRFQGIGLARDERSFEVLAQAARQSPAGGAGGPAQGLGFLQGDVRKTLAILDAAFAGADADPKGCKGIVSAYAELRSPLAVERLYKLAKHKEPQFVYRALDGLTLVPGKRALAALKAAVDHEDPEVQESAHWSLIRRMRTLGDVRLDYFVNLATKGKTVKKRAASVRALAIHSGPEVVKPLRLAAADPDPAVRAAACESLGRVVDVRGVPELLKGIKDKNAGVQAAALNALQLFLHLPEVAKVVKKSESGGESF